jgi:hypothetical protein
MTVKFHFRENSYLRNLNFLWKLKAKHLSNYVRNKIWM